MSWFGWLAGLGFAIVAYFSLAAVVTLSGLYLSIIAFSFGFIFTLAAQRLEKMLFGHKYTWE